MVSERMCELLRTAADELAGHNDPFESSWFHDADMSFDECMNFSELLGLAARALADGPPELQRAILLSGSGVNDLAPGITREMLKSMVLDAERARLGAALHTT